MDIPIVNEGDRRYVDVGLPTLLHIDPTTPPKVEDDGYPDVIRDARHAYGCETAEQIEDHWLTVLERAHVVPWTREPFDEIAPYVNRARWLIDCPGCNAGNFVWDQMTLGCCLDCGLLVKVAWQSPFVRSAAVRLLAVRPVVNCNWDAHKGETLEDLERENRWLLNEPSIEKSGLVVPVGLTVPEALERYIDPKVA